MGWVGGGGGLVNVCVCVCVCARARESGGGGVGEVGEGGCQCVCVCVRAWRLCLLGHKCVCMGGQGGGGGEEQRELNIVLRTNTKDSFGNRAERHDLFPDNTDGKPGVNSVFCTWVYRYTRATQLDKLVSLRGSVSLNLPTSPVSFI